MDKAKIKKLERAGFRVTTTKDWLQLTPTDEKLIEMRMALAAELESLRKEMGLTQAQLAKKLGTKQSGVARMINNPDTASIDALIKGLITMGASVSRIAACLMVCASVAKGTLS